MHLVLKKIWAETPLLAGAINGKEALQKLLLATMIEPSAPELLFLDFSDIEVATASFLRESILAFRDLVRGRRSTLYPVIANASDAVREELIILLQSKGDALMTCALTADGEVTNAALIGNLEPKQRITFDLVGKHGETGAGELMRGHGKDEGLTNSTAWNNRLASLAGLGLLMEISEGRAKRYKPLFEGA